MLACEEGKAEPVVDQYSADGATERRAAEADPDGREAGQPAEQARAADHLRRGGRRDRGVRAARAVRWPACAVPPGWHPARADDRDDPLRAVRAAGPVLGDRRAARRGGRGAAEHARRLDRHPRRRRQPDDGRGAPGGRQARSDPRRRGRAVAGDRAARVGAEEDRAGRARRADPRVPGWQRRGADPGQQAAAEDHHAAADAAAYGGVRPQRPAAGAAADDADAEGADAQGRPPAADAPATER